MKNKILILLSVFIFCMTLGLKDAMAAAATDVACKAPCINSFEIEDGQVTSSDIANGAVTDSRITGPISSSKIQKPANVIVVAKSGGGFTSIQAAIDSVTPSATNPYLIKVMPGAYVENITMKSYIHLQGAGRDVTTIQAPSTEYVIALRSLTNVAISGFTITGGFYGIDNRSSSPTITENTFTGNQGGGIYNDNSSPVIGRNIMKANYFGIYNINSSSTIAENTFTGNTYGILSVDSDTTPSIMDNIITGNIEGVAYIIFSSVAVRGTLAGNTIVGNSDRGIDIGGGYSSYMIINNRITGNGGGDIWVVTESSVPNISFNVYDTISGDTGVGQYNVKSDGSPAPAP
ncbi:MAG: hypothetical protein A3G39_10370 [Deltaproteobacteria bacterium RIFCSPLOWO2_12_FULL_43_16]|nr:MAG: hypothetical protein A2Z89_08865 [Deltaproteobacteria bacterium GWA2_43_19]OGQ12156.1 MAG: hypothetical protein A3D30_00840 [Deltaproteobacteria bacterium RIFCSPHIGHO2_02_FULL_43_33]OGQ58275.1 MAG: hypothetical protein A3G39_10370 [Deltaproteobacteria bacterium RIFCSPLOWO2_12_FULL_43_16]HBR16853.1 hypothetical protein [Deltaproteobacteria bacterium]